jgi:hypothetical protein
MIGHGRLPAESKRGDDLAELTTRFEITMRLDDFVERKRTIDHRFEFAFVKAAANIGDRRLEPFRIAARFPDIVALDRGHLGDHLQERQRRDGVTQRAIDVDGALGGERRYEFRKIGSADRVEGDARTLAAGQPA